VSNENQALVSDASGERQTTLVEAKDSVKLHQHKILVVYGGPTDVLDPSIPPEKIRPINVKPYKYYLNFEYFLKYGVQCKTQDTLIVVTEKVLPSYKDRIQVMDNECQRKYGHKVFVTTRENKCLDLEVLRVAIFGTVVNVSSYDYFFYVNCGVSGPAKEVADLPWTDLFLAKFRDGIKMTGLSHNCQYPHIQSMMYAMDREGLNIVVEGRAIFDCLKKFPDFNKLKPAVAHGRIVNGYERRMSELILKAGYGFNPLLRPQSLFEHNRSRCEGDDLWLGGRLKELNGKGRIPYLNETVFFKTTRYLSPEIAQEIGYKAEISGNWE
jgi:hypothetical protein